MKNTELNHLKETIRKNINLVDYIGQSVELIQQGSVYCGHHPGHDSISGKSLVIWPDTQTYKCFNCGEQGDIFTWIMKSHNVGFMDAFQKIAYEAGIELGNHDSDIISRWSKSESEKRRLLEGLEIATAFYQSQLTKEHREHLRDRGLTDETINKWRIGYAPPSGHALWNHFITLGYGFPLQTGLFFANNDGTGRDFFRGHLIFPYLVNSQPRYFIGRRTESTPDDEWEKSKYKKQLVHSEKKGFISKEIRNDIFYGLDTLKTGEPAVLTEGPFDVMLAAQAGFAAFSPVTTRFPKRSYPDLLKTAEKPSSVYIINDAEDSGAGQNGATDTASFLEQNGINVFVVELPRSERQTKIDLADYLNQNEPEALQTLIEATNPYYMQMLTQNPKPSDKSMALVAARDYVCQHLDHIADEFLIEGHLKANVIPHFGLLKSDAPKLLKAWRDAREKYSATIEQDMAKTESLSDNSIVENIKAAYFIGDNFSPQLLGQEIANENPLFSHANDLYLYQNGVYVPDSQSIIQRIAQEKLGVLSQSRFLRETEIWLKVAHFVNPDLVDSQPYILNLENGLLDTFTGEFKPHSAEFLSTIRLPVKFDPLAQSKLWPKFLSEVVAPDTVPLLLEFLAYCLLPDTRFETNLMLIGAGANGKSTLLEAFSALIGTANISNVPLQELSEHKFKRAELLNKLVNIFSDLPARAVQDSSFFKMITSGDRIDAERKFQHPFSFNPFARLLFSANELPASADNSDAFFRRWKIIPFPNSFPPEKRDVKLKSKLTQPEELSGLLNLLLEALRRLYKNECFSDSATAVQALHQYKLRSDPIAGFIEEECILESYAVTPFSQLYHRYQSWCDDTGSRSMTMRRFNGRIRELKTVDETRDSKTRSWVGIAPRSNNHPQLRSVK